MLNMLEGFDVKALGFGTADGVHLLAEVMKIAFADRAVATADPDFVAVPVDRLISRAYADAAPPPSIDMTRAARPRPRHRRRRRRRHHPPHRRRRRTATSSPPPRPSTRLFGARVAVPGTGLILNNYMFNFDPHPGHALSIAPGKRVFTSMAPMMALRDGRLAYALGLPGALRIFPSAMQALINLIDHGMTLQQAVEAPRMFTQGHVLELESAALRRLAAPLAARGHDVVEHAPHRRRHERHRLRSRTQ